MLSTTIKNKEDKRIKDTIIREKNIVSNLLAHDIFFASEIISLNKSIILKKYICLTIIFTILDK